MCVCWKRFSREWESISRPGKTRLEDFVKTLAGNWPSEGTPTPSLPPAHAGSRPPKVHARGTGGDRGRPSRQAPNRGAVRCGRGSAGGSRRSAKRGASCQGPRGRIRAASDGDASCREHCHRRFLNGRRRRLPPLESEPSLSLALDQRKMWPCDVHAEAAGSLTSATPAA